MTFVPFPSGTVIAYAGATIPSGWILCNGSTYSISDYSDLYASLSLTQSITTNSTTTVTTSSTDTLAVGALVVASGVPSGAYIASITNSTTFVLSAAATASATVSATFRQYDRQIDPTTGSAYAEPSAGTFRVPDYRGLFLRGVGTPSGKNTARLGDRQAETTKLPTAAFGATAAAQSWSYTAASGTAAAQSFSGSSSGSTGADLTHGHTMNNTPHNVGIAGVAAGGGGTGIAVLNGVSINNSGNLNHSHNTTAAGTNSASSVSGVAGTNGTSAVSSFTGGDNETRPLNKGINYIIKV